LRFRVQRPWLRLPDRGWICVLHLSHGLQNPKHPAQTKGFIAFQGSLPLKGLLRFEKAARVSCRTAGCGKKLAFVLPAIGPVTIRATEARARPQSTADSRPGHFWAQKSHAAVPRMHAAASASFPGPTDSSHPRSFFWGNPGSRRCFMIWEVSSRKRESPPNGG